MGRSGGFRDAVPGSGSGWRGGSGTAPAGQHRAALPSVRDRSVRAGLEYQRQIERNQGGKPQRHRPRQLAQQVVVPGVAVLAVLPFDMRDGARRSGFERRIHRRQDGERRGLKEDDGQNAEPAKIPRLSRRNELHSYAARVFPGAARGHPDLLHQAAYRGGTSQGNRALRLWQSVFQCGDKPERGVVSRGRGAVGVRFSSG